MIALGFLKSTVDESVVLLFLEMKLVTLCIDISSVPVLVSLLVFCCLS
jgi:hypothetical protein